MTSCVYRFFLMLLGLSPMAIAFACVDVTTLLELFYHIMIALAFIALCLTLFYYCLNKIARDLEPVYIKPESISRKREGLTGYFLAYVLPILLTGPAQRWALFAIVLILVISGLRTKSLGYNPIAELIGFNFYEINDGSGIELFVISRKEPQELLKGFYGVNFTEDYFIVP